MNFAPASVAAAPRLARLGTLLGQTRRLLAGSLDRELARHDISAAQFIVLAKLASLDGACAAGLCKEIGYDPGAMARMLDRLQAKGLLRRLPSAEDRRTTTLQLTERGQALLPELQDGWAAVVRRFVRGFDEEDLRQFERFLHRVQANG